MALLLQRVGNSWKPDTGSMLKFSLELHAELWLC